MVLKVSLQNERGEVVQTADINMREKTGKTFLSAGASVAVTNIFGSLPNGATKYTAMIDASQVLEESVEDNNEVASAFIPGRVDQTQVQSPAIVSLKTPSFFERVKEVVGAVVGKVINRVKDEVVAIFPSSVEYPLECE